MYVITRETIYFINLRHAYLLAPFNSARLSSRTVLFTEVPREYLNAEKLQQLFGKSLRRFWLTTDCSDLEDDVKERDQVALKLEGAEIKLSKTANDKRLKWEKNNAKNNTPVRDAGDEEAASNSQKWLDKKDRPTHRLGKIPLVGKKVDTIDHSRSELKTLVTKVEKAQKEHQNDHAKLLPSIFIEFATQHAAEVAYRRMTPRKVPHFNPRAISVTPDEIVWENMKINKKQRWIREFATQSFITAMIIFWAIPVAVVGAISNINYVVNLVPFLSFIEKIPKVILGVITGLLPSVMLALLMAVVPIICRYVAKIRGEVTLPGIELKTQGWYMAFQVIQVFLVTTFASGAAAVVTQIINNPGSATTLLAENLPKASNFYISYFILQGLGIAAGNLLNIGSLAMLTIVGKFLDKSPRKMFKRYITLAGLGWGSLYPKFGCLGIIAITYAIISPLVLGFATIGFGLIYLSVRYNSFYVFSNNIDTKGAAYAKVMQQLMTGVYLSEVCLIGLFSINTAPGPIVLMAVFLGFTIIYHILMRQALHRLTQYLPDNMDDDAQLAMFATTDTRSYDASKAGAPPSEAPPLPPTGLAAKQAAFFSRLFDPRKFKSHQAVHGLLPNYPPPRYEEQEEAKAYFNPAVTSEKPKLWIVRDEMGISRQECKDSWDMAEIEMTDEGATFNEKGKVVWEEKKVQEVPIWEKRVDY
jgi:hypothetical protein